jgi:uncharacterized membrane protein
VTGVSPLVLWPSALGASALAAGLYTHRRDLSSANAGYRARMLACGPVFIAAALAAFSGEHFTQAREFSRLVPAWLPFRLPLTYAVGVCLLAAAVSFVFRRCLRWSASLLALLFALFVLLIYLPSATTHPGVRIVWIFPFREGTFAVGAFCIYLFEAGAAEHSRLAALALRLWTAVVAMFFGVENILYPRFAPGVPDQQPTSAWVPQPHVVAYVTGALLVAMGVGMLFRKTAVASIAAVGVLMTVLAIGLFAPDLILAATVPQRVNAMNFVADTLLFAGTMFAIARAVEALSGREPPSGVSVCRPERPRFQKRGNRPN